MQPRTFLLMTLLLFPALAHAQVLGDPADVSQDFQKMENVYFVGSRVTSFDTNTGNGTLQWDRYLRNTTLSFNKIDVGFTRGKATEFPGTEYDQDPALPFSITFVSPRTVRLRMSTRAVPMSDGQSLMLAGPVPKDSSWKVEQNDREITYTSAHGRIKIFRTPGTRPTLCQRICSLPISAVAIHDSRISRFGLSKTTTSCRWPRNTMCCRASMPTAT